MDKIINFGNLILDYLKTYGAEGVFWLAVVGYVLSLVMPQFQNSLLTSNNVILLGMLSLGIKLSTDKLTRRREHTKGNEDRLAANLEVRNELLNLKSDLNANRVYILEMHNGNKNNANLPFLYADMTFEETNGIQDCNREFQNINLSLFPFAEYIFKNNIYIGSVEGLKDIDMKFYNRIAEQGAKNCAMAVLRYRRHLIGLVGVSLPYEITDENKIDIHDSLMNHGNVISDYLTLKD